MNQLIVAIIGLFLVSSTVCSASDAPFPEFECTAIEIKEPVIAKEILGSSKHPSVSLRRYSSGAWQFKIKDRSADIEAHKVVKSEKAGANEVSYELPDQQKQLKFDLKGKSPSRSGLLWELNSPPMLSKMIARITCH